MSFGEKPKTHIPTYPRLRLVIEVEDAAYPDAPSDMQYNARYKMIVLDQDGQTIEVREGDPWPSFSTEGKANIQAVADEGWSFVVAAMNNNP